MKKQNKLSIKVRDLEPLKDVMGGRRRRHGLQAIEARATNRLVGEYGGGLGPDRIQQGPITDRERTARGSISRCGS
jgi:hypothetical protein